MLSDGHVSSEGFKLIVEAETEDERAAWITAICTTLVAKTEVAPQDVEKEINERGAAAAAAAAAGGGRSSTAGGGAGSVLAGSAPSGSRIVKDGVLRKKAIGKSMLGSMLGSLGENWKDRYFCLTSDRLEYFGKKGDAKAKGGVDVSNINGVEVWSGGPGPGFEIHCNVLSDGHVDSAGYGGDTSALCGVYCVVCVAWSVVCGLWSVVWCVLSLLASLRPASSVRRQADYPPSRVNSSFSSFLFPSNVY